MYALRPPDTSLPPVRRSQTAPRSRPQANRHPHRSLTIESTVKLTVNLVLSTAAVSAVIHLLPYRTAQEAKLQELHVAVKSSGERLQRTQFQFSRYFDPYQTRALMQEQSNRVDPQQKQIVLQGPKISPKAVPAIARKVEQLKAKGY